MGWYIIIPGYEQPKPEGHFDSQRAGQTHLRAQGQRSHGVRSLRAEGKRDWVAAIRQTRCCQVRQNCGKGLQGGNWRSQGLCRAGCPAAPESQGPPPSLGLVQTHGRQYRNQLRKTAETLQTLSGAALACSQRPADCSSKAGATRPSETVAPAKQPEAEGSLAEIKDAWSPHLGNRELQVPGLAHGRRG